MAPPPPRLQFRHSGNGDAKRTYILRLLQVGANDVINRYNGLRGVSRRPGGVRSEVQGPQTKVQLLQLAAVCPWMSRSPTLTLSSSSVNCERGLMLTSCVLLLQHRCSCLRLFCFLFPSSMLPGQECICFPPSSIPTI